MAQVFKCDRCGSVRENQDILAVRLRELCAKIREWKRTGVDAIPSERELRLIHRASLALESPAPDVIQRVREAAMLGLSWGAGQALMEKEKALRDIYAMCDQSAPVSEPSPLRAEAAPLDDLIESLELSIKARQDECDQMPDKSVKLWDYRQGVIRGMRYALTGVRLLAESPRLPAAPAPWTREQVRVAAAALEGFCNRTFNHFPKQIQMLRYLAQTLPATVPAPATAPMSKREFNKAFTQQIRETLCTCEGDTSEVVGTSRRPISATCRVHSNPDANGHAPAREQE